MFKPKSLPHPIHGALTASIMSLVLKISGLCCALVFQLLLLHYAGATAFGEFSFYIAWALTLAAVARFGSDTLAMRLAPLFISEGKEGVLSGFLRFAVSGVAATGLAIGAAFLLGASLLSDGNETLLVPSTALASAAISIPLVSLAIVTEAILRSHGYIIRGSLSTVVSSVVSISLLFLTRHLGYAIDAATAIHIFAAGHLVAILPLTVYMARIWPAAPPQFDRRSWLKIALPLGISSTIGIFQGQCGTICCGLLATPADAGRFAIAIRFAGILLVGQQAINAVLAPRFSTCHARNDRLGLQHLATLSAWGALIVAGMGCMGFMLLNQFAGHYAPSLDSDAMTLTMLLMSGTLVAALSGSVGYIMLMTGHQTQVLIILTASLLLTVGLNIALAPIFGAMGSAVAQVAATLSTNGVLFFLTRRYLGINSVIGRLPIGSKKRRMFEWAGDMEPRKPAAA